MRRLVPWVIVAALTAGVTGVSITQSLERYRALRTGWSWDLAYYNQWFWALTKGDRVLTVRPLSSYADEGPSVWKMNYLAPVRFLIAPIYRIWPDPRTLLIGSEQQFQELIRAGPAARPAWAVAAGWERVEHDIFACAITNQEQRFSKLWLVSPPEEVPAEVNAAVAKATAVVFGLDYDGELRGDLFSLCANQQDAITVAHTLLNWIAKGRTVVQLALEKSPDARMLSGKKLLEQITVGLEGGGADDRQAVVHAQGHAKVNHGDFFDLMSAAKVEAVEVKGK